jgi:hypothetical protein
LVIQNSSPPIFDRVFDRSHHDNDNQRDGIQTGVIGTKNGEELE